MSTSRRLSPARATVTWLCLLAATTVGHAQDLESEAYGAIACKSRFNAATARGCGRGLEASQAPGSGPQKIIQGRPVLNGDYPWVVAIAHKLSTGRLWVYCGGSIVAKTWVLTAAHCDVKNGDYVLVNRHDLTTDAGQQVAVDRIVPSKPAYQPRSKAYDVQLLHLVTAVAVDPIDLNTDPNLEQDANTKLTIAGWGTTSYLGKASAILLEADVSTRALAGCQSRYQHTGHALPPTSFCAAGDKPGGLSVDPVTGQAVADACQGDSGGGAFRQDASTGKYQLVGVISWGIGCGDDAYPGVYTRSSSISAWVKPFIAKQT